MSGFDTTSSQLLEGGGLVTDLKRARGPRRTLRGMQSMSPLEDWRGVDVGQIREQLRLPVRERVRVMVEAANVLLGVQEHARRARNSEAS